MMAAHNPSRKTDRKTEKRVKGYRQHKGATHFETVLEESTEDILKVANAIEGDGSLAMEDAFMVPLNWLKSNPEQPRQFFNEAKIERYADSMRLLSAKGQGIHGSGIIQALNARRAPGSIDPSGQWIKGPGCLIIVAGETRWHAAKRAGLDRVPVTVRDASEDDAYEMSLFENIHRADLTPMEEAISYRALMNQKKMGIRRFAEYIGKDRGEVWNRLSLLDMTEDEQAVLSRKPDTIGSLQAVKRTRKDPAFHKHLLQMIAQGARQVDIVKEVQSWARRQQAAAKDEGGRLKDEVQPTGLMETVSTTHPSSLIPQSYYGHGPGPDTLPRIAYHEHLQSVVNQLANIHDAIKGVPPTPTERNTKTLPLLLEARRLLGLIEADSARVIERRAQGKI